MTNLILVSTRTFPRHARWRGRLLFRGVLEEALRRFNPGMMENAIRSVAENLLALPLTIEGNR